MHFRLYHTLTPLLTEDDVRMYICKYKVHACMYVSVCIYFSLEIIASG